MATARHDVFLSYHGADRDRVDAVRCRLAERGVRAFLDRHDLVAGLPWPQALEEALQSVRAVLVFVGRGDSHESLGLWQRREVWFALDRQAHEEGQGRAFPVIPVLLPGARPDAGFLFLNTWVDLRETAAEPAAVDGIVSAVTGTARPLVEVPALAFAPYRALEAFREEHAALFFGREAFSSALLDTVRLRSLVALVGPSGSGKSSLVEAGLVPLLRRQRPPQPAWDVVVFRPGDEPFHRLAASLIPLLEPDADEVDRLTSGRKLGERLADRSVRLADVTDRLLARSRGTDRLLLVADQFEELFTFTPAPHQQPFASVVLDALDRAPLTFLLALRADFYAQAIALDRGLSDRIQSGLVNLGPMTRDELRRAVEQPAAKAGVSFEPGLVDRILGHVERQPGSLPLLEFALAELWERPDAQQITHAAYEAIGEVSGAISRRAEKVFGGLEVHRQRAALSLFTRLVRPAGPGDPEPDTRRRVPVDALTEPERGVVKPFGDARLLVLDRDESVAAAQTVEITHEALIRGWRRLGEWVDQQREFLLWRQRLGQALTEWKRAGRDKEALLRGAAFKEAAGWARQRKADLSAPESEFIGLSRRRVRRRRRWVGAAFAVFVLGVAALWGLGRLYRTNAAQVWIAIHRAPTSFDKAPPSGTAAWIHAAVVAGHLDAIGSTFLGSPRPQRLEALRTAARMMADLGRTADANRLADRAIALVHESDAPGWVHMSMARTLVEIGRREDARLFARRALALARETGEALDLALCATALAWAGLGEEASDAIAEARAAPPPKTIFGDRPRRDPFEKDMQEQGRAGIVGALAEALVRNGGVDEGVTLALEVVQRQRDPSLAKTRHPGWRAVLPVVQALIDGGHFEHARNLVARSDNPLAVAMVASALALQGRSREAGVLVETTLALVEEGVEGPAVRDEERALFYRRLLLGTMEPIDAIALVRDRGNVDAIASFAVALAESGRPELGVEVARDAVRRIDSLATANDRPKVLVKATQALAQAGQTEAALSMARTIEEPEEQVVALAHAAHGFGAIDPDRAQALADEVEELLMQLFPLDAYSTVRSVLRLTNVRLGQYAAAFDHPPKLTDADTLAIYTEVIRDDALRRDKRLRAAFQQEPGRGLGRLGLYVP